MSMRPGISACSDMIGTLSSGTRMAVDNSPNDRSRRCAAGRLHLRAWALLSALIWLPACGSQAGAPPTTYYVDFDHGSDQAYGQAETQAWQHAPGDPQAQDGPRRTRLGPGDKVLFRGGVIYRGAIRLDDSGAADQPITYSGLGFGAGRAIISGRDLIPVRVRACEASAGCAGLAAAADLRVVELPQPVKPSDQVVVDGQMLHLAQTPELPDSFWYDDLRHYQRAALSDLTLAGGRWRLRHGFIRKSLGSAPLDDLVVHIWGQPNAVSSVRAEAYDPASSAVLLQAPELMPYEHRDTLFALANHPALIRRAHEFATLDNGARLVVKAPLPPGDRQVEISRRGAAFTLGEVSHVVLQGFDIQGFTGGERDWGAGSALLSSGKPADDVTFRDNEVHDLTSWDGSGAVHVSNISRLSVIDNRIFRLWRGAGVMLGGKSQDIQIRRNSFDQIGRTGMLVIGARRVWIDRNRLSGLFAHHGNGISIYLGNQDVLISNNLIGETTRALTFQGGGGVNAQPNRIVIRRNLIQATGDEAAAVQSWGGPTLGVTLEGNVLLAPEGGFALRLTDADQDLLVRHNLVAGMAVGGSPPANWILRDNVFLADNYIVSPDADAAWARVNKAPIFGFAGQAAAMFGKPPVAGPKACAALLGAGEAPAGLAWLGADQAKLSPGIGPDDLCAP
jgi:hypothetical protein